MKIPLSLSARDTRVLPLTLRGFRGVSRGSRVRVDFLSVTSSSTRELAILARKRLELPLYSSGYAGNIAVLVLVCEKRSRRRRLISIYLTDLKTKSISRSRMH